MAARYLVVGLGRFGMAVAESLAEEGVEVVALDSSMELVEKVRDRVTFAAQLDATDPDALRAIDAHACQMATVAIGEAFEQAALVVAALKEVGVPHILARARTTRQGRILVAAGATEVIEVESELGKRLAKTLVTR
jgi:trk system potassium uptake protein